MEIVHDIFVYVFFVFETIRLYVCFVVMVKPAGNISMDIYFFFFHIKDWFSFSVREKEKKIS